MDAEIQEFVALLDRVKSGVRDFVREIGDEGVVWSPDVPDTNSVAVLVTHMFGSETEVTQEFVGGITVSRDRGSEFARPLTTVGELIDLIFQARQVRLLSANIGGGVVDIDVSILDSFSSGV